MKVLIVGQPGYFVNPLIQRLRKESVDTYLLYGHKNPHRSSKNVHEEYVFPLDSRSVSYVVEDVKPDCIIFAGAADSAYQWYRPSEDGVKMTAALSNLLLCAKASGIRRFYFLSSEEVFDCGTKAAEKPNVPQKSEKGFVLAQCENLCLSYGIPGKLQTYVLRISSLYGNPSYPGEICGRVTEAVRTALSADPGTPNAEEGYYPTFTSDAVQVLFQLVSHENWEPGVYHVTGEELFTDADIAAAVNHTKPKEHSCTATALQMGKTADLTDFQQKYKLQDTLPGLKRDLADLDHSEKKPGKKEEKRKPSRIWKFLKPIVETVVFFLLLVLLSMVVQYFPGLEDLDIMLMYVLVVAVAFGKPATVLAVLLATGLQVWQGSASGMSLAVAVLSMPTVCRLLNLFAAGMIAAHCRDRLKWKYDDITDEKSQLMFELETVKAMNDSNARIKRHLEEQIVNMDDSLGKIHSIVSGLDSVQPNQVIYNAVEIIKQIMHVQDVALYSIAATGGAYARRAAYSGEQDCPMDRSLRLQDYPEMMKALRRNQIFVNTAMDPNLPLMACPVKIDDQMSTIVMVWNADFDRLTPYHVNLMMVLGNMISGSLARAEVYTSAVKSQQYVKGTEILNPENFRNTLNMVKTAVKQDFASWVQLTLDANKMELNELNNILVNILRNEDYIGMDDQNRIHVLLANSDPEGAAIVLERLKKNGIQAHIMEI